jgi:hypothetical protein
MHGIPTFNEAPRDTTVFGIFDWDRGDREVGVIVATESFLERIFSLTVEVPSLPECEIEAELGDNVPGEFGRFVSTITELSRCIFLILASFSGRGGGRSGGFAFAVWVDVVERIDDTDLPFREGVLVPGGARETFLEREVVVCEVAETADAVESRRT